MRIEFCSLTEYFTRLDKTGLIDRELEIYNKLSKHHEVTLITLEMKMI